MREAEVIECLEAYLNAHRVGFVRRKVGPDFKLEDGSVIEAKGSKWGDVGAVMRQLIEYYMTSPSMGLAVPADSLNVDRVYRLLLLEKALIYSKREGKPITVYCITKSRKEGLYKLLKFNSVEELFRQVTDDLVRKIGISRWSEVAERIEHIGGYLKRTSDDLFRNGLVSTVSERGYELKYT